MFGVPEKRPDLVPLDVRAAPVVAIGTALWVVALIVVWVAGGPTSWRWTCVCGVALGLLGVVVSARMQRG